jgi:hypothetical protein
MLGDGASKSVNVSTESNVDVDVVQLEAVHAQLELLHERCSSQLLLIDEVQSELARLDARLRGLLPASSDLFRLYDRRMRERTDWWQQTGSGYVDTGDCRNIGRRIGLMREILASIDPEFLRDERFKRTQYYFQRGERFRARQRFYQLLRRASSRVAIIDPYLDVEVLDFVDELDPKIEVRLLTNQAKSLFTKQLTIMQGSGRFVEARSSASSHDRFVILDDQEVWHLGASINGLGKKACMINKVVDDDEAKRLLGDYAGWWLAAARVQSRVS